MMNWLQLKSRCIKEVARELARPKVCAEGGDLARWGELMKEAEPEAILKIQSMSNMELLDLISEVAGRE